MANLFEGVFKLMDKSDAIQSVTNLIGVDSSDAQAARRMPVDKTFCIIHKKERKQFFCEQCLFELCVTCKNKHDKSHPVKLIEESAQFVIDRFRDSLDHMIKKREMVKEASNRDPSLLAIPEGHIDIIEQGGKEIDYIFEKLQTHVDLCKQ